MADSIHTTGFKGKSVQRRKAMRKFHEALPAAAAFIVELFENEDKLTPEEYKQMIMRKEAAESVLAYGMGRPGMQQMPKPKEQGPVPLIEFSLGDMEQQKKDGSPDTEAS